MRITVVTGSASGIGAAVSKALQGAGHRVIGIDRQNADIAADLSTPDGRRAAIDAVLERCGGVLDGLVCCAGVGATAPSAGLVIGVNYFGVTALVDGLADALAKGQRPAALIIGSIASTQQGADSQPMVEAMLAGDEAQARELADALGAPHVAYASSKFAVTRYARQKAVAWGKQGMRLNVVAPGAVETPLLQASKDDPRFGEAVKNFVAPLGRAGEPHEIAGVVAFLQSEQAGFVHGTVVFVDGGMDAMVRPASF
ncbi:SDR family oxidoreductase [Aromatoleum diolicum]|uniref:SDR family oxidoreductase n=1 Tax=Aromatoleum diolicum TaxID=75796 RepID=A0ABX1QJR0_9RHOO|nr:SDR family oxidoreductase [Aromatoleum diolicum]NMG77609.1 SDR family oxidoreductase [Aromatoleum diolicum]